VIQELLNQKEGTPSKLLIAPTWAVLQLDVGLLKDGLGAKEFLPELAYTFGPHLDMDHIGEMIETGIKVGWRDAVGLQVRRVRSGDKRRNT